jgi:hypothetical protein
MSDERFTQTTLRAPRVDQEQAIAFRTIIENVFSGSGSDDVFGNDADNEIHAGASDDLITGVQRRFLFKCGTICFHQRGQHF